MEKPKQHNPSVASDSLPEAFERMKLSEAEEKKKQKKKASDQLRC